MTTAIMEVNQFKCIQQQSFCVLDLKFEHISVIHLAYCTVADRCKRPTTAQNTYLRRNTLRFQKQGKYKNKNVCRCVLRLLQRLKKKCSVLFFQRFVSAALLINAQVGECFSKC